MKLNLSLNYKIEELLIRYFLQFLYSRLLTYLYLYYNRICATGVKFIVSS